MVRHPSEPPEVTFSTLAISGVQFMGRLDLPERCHK
jgi:hypothetical protein